MRRELMTDEDFMEEALREAQAAYDAGEVPVGAVVVCGDEIIARGHNQTQALVDVTAHAEMIAITAAANALGGKYLSDCTLYVTVEPCIMCAGALGWSQIKRVVYGAADERRGFASYYGQPSPLHPKTMVRAGVLAQECATLMKRFFAQKR